MAKPGRNNPCPCGSGKKYKKCCLTNDQAAKHEQLVAQQAEREQRAAVKQLELRRVREAIAAGLTASNPFADDVEDDLTETVDAALGLLDDGKLEQAEVVAHDLMERFPDIPDGWEFLGRVHEKRGENQKAVECYRRMLEIIRRTPDDFDPEFVQQFVDLIAKLDPHQTT
jgi:tetratricopeptide (TPR) repeat protein